MSFYDTTICQSFDMAYQAHTVCEYLVKNPHCVLDNETTVKTILQHRVYSQTPSAYVATHLPSSVYSHIAFVYPDRQFPEILANPYLFIDLYQLPQANKLVSSLGDIHNKLIFSLRPYARLQDGALSINGIDWLHTKLFQAYTIMQDAEDTMIQPFMQAYMAKCYSMISTGVLSKAFDATDNDTNLLATLLCIYYLKLMHTKYVADGIPQSLWTIQWMRYKVKEVARQLQNDEEMQVYLKKPKWSLSELVSIINQLCEGRLKRMSRGDYVGRLSTIAGDSVTSALVHEFPPYWLATIIQSDSGASTGISRYIKMAGSKERGEMKKFVSKYIMSPNFLKFNRK